MNLERDVVAAMASSRSHTSVVPAQDSKPVLKWVCSRPRLVERQVADETNALELLKSVGFTDELLNAPVASLSGGWRMKLSLVVAALMDADILLLDLSLIHI